MGPGCGCAERGFRVVKTNFAATPPIGVCRKLSSVRYQTVDRRGCSNEKCAGGKRGLIGGIGWRSPAGIQCAGPDSWRVLVGGAGACWTIHLQRELEHLGVTV